MRILKTFKVIVVGEHHGTKEIPALVSRLVQAMLEDGSSLALCLEIVGKYNQEILDQFQKSGDRKHLNSMPHFRGKLNNGSSTEAIANLMIELSGIPNVDFLAFDAAMEDWPIVDDNGRDLAMASNIAKFIETQKYDRMLILTGNFHSSKIPIKSLSPTLNSMIFELCENEKFCIDSKEIFSVLVGFEESDFLQNRPYNWLAINQEHFDMEEGSVCFNSAKKGNLVHGHDAIIYFKKVSNSPSYCQLIQ